MMRARTEGNVVCVYVCVVRVSVCVLTAEHGFVMRTTENSAHRHCHSLNDAACSQYTTGQRGTSTTDAVHSPDHC